MGHTPSRYLASGSELAEPVESGQIVPVDIGL